MNAINEPRRRGRKRRQDTPAAETSPPPQGGALKNPFPQMAIFSDDFIEEMHQSALTILEEMGLRILLDEAVDLYRKGGARVADDGQTVHIGREMVEAALATAPKSITMRAGARHRDLELALGNLVFQPGAGAPYVNDRERGRRPGSLNDFRELVQITHHFDALHMIPPLVEAQDIPVNLRHYAMLEAELTLTDKVPFIFSRGTPQVEDSFEMMRDFRGISDDEFFAEPWCYTIINTNSPRQIDIPMAQGLIDFARAGQMSIVTPFTLMGAMAPITVAGAITLSHAEALAAITLTQLVRPGAPVCYGTFTSNVDMKSGAPAFGTPEHFRASVAAGQLARKIGLPWRSASGSAANINDAQAANETQMGTWGCLLGGATVVIHAAGWQEGGLTVGYEKLITDMEGVQMIADLCRDYQGRRDDIGLDAIAGIEPGGHFFGCDHTMARYRTEFYEHIVADLSNFGTWTENGAIDAHERATGVWKSILEHGHRPDIDQDKVEALQAFIARRTAEGGADAVS
ncbi:MAG: trimethylamine methyltransferase family protein [Candidatus Puniceispirillales bacterium]